MGDMTVRRIVLSQLPPWLIAAFLVMALFGESAAAAVRSVEAAAPANRPGEVSATPADWIFLEDPAVGVALFYPPEWSVEGPVAATQFAATARCRSVRMVDFEPPADSGAAASVDQSYVQICVTPLSDGDSLESYMRRTYGESLARRFAKTDLNGACAYEDRGHTFSRTIFTRAGDRLIQIVTAVATVPERMADRKAQIERILGGLIFK